MTHPFPGMNPWLENPALWRDVHHSLISVLRETLSPILRPRYFVAVETHTYIAAAPDTRPTTRYPDVMIINRGGPAVATPVMEGAPYVTVSLPQPVEEGYLEVRLVPSGEVVTVIELLSHSNKQSDRKTYLSQREKTLNTFVNFVEIDLLRAGPPMPYTEEANSHYRLFIRRSEEATAARLYPFSVRQPIPTFPLPLRPDDQEPIVDLGALLQSVYDRAGYDLILDYTKPPTPPLEEGDGAWAAEILQRI